MTRFRRSWPWWRWVLPGLSVLALGLSAYLSWHYLAGSSVIGCGGGSPCDQVLSSRWSAVAGVVPVSGLAAGAYLAMLVASVYIGPATEASVRRLAWGALLVLVGAVSGSAVWFIFVQKWVIGAFCPYCMAVHITGLLLAALVIWRASIQVEDDSTGITLANPSPNATTGIAPRRVVDPIPAIGLAFVGVAVAGVLATCQVVLKPSAAYRDGESQDDVTALDPRAVPLVGSPDAPYVVTLLFDYKCPHCQQLHFLLDEAIRRYGGKLAFALCPAPLSRGCNPYVLGDENEFEDSCELAKVGLAVWVARHDAFPSFQRWMFSFESGNRWQPRSLEAARAKAIELVGQPKLDAAMADYWIDRYMETCIRIYGQTIQSGNGGIPKLVFGSRWVIPELYDADDLVSILHDSLAVPGPQPEE